MAMTILEAIFWLMLTLYGEARGESREGQRAVVQVILNRAKASGTTVKHEVLKPKQFSMYNDGIPDSVKPRIFFDLCIPVAQAGIGWYLGFRGNDADHYHTVNVNPYWARDERMEYLYTIGDHKFYKWNG